MSIDRRFYTEIEDIIYCTGIVRSRARNLSMSLYSFARDIKDTEFYCNPDHLNKLNKLYADYVLFINETCKSCENELDPYISKCKELINESFGWLLSGSDTTQEFVDHIENRLYLISGRYDYVKSMLCKEAEECIWFMDRGQDVKNIIQISDFLKEIEMLATDIGNRYSVLLRELREFDEIGARYEANRSENELSHVIDDVVTVTLHAIARGTEEGSSAGKGSNAHFIY